MSSLLSNSDISYFKNQYARHFDTFSYDRTRLLTVFKEPIKTIVQNSAAFYGYSQAQPSSVTYTTVSGIYPVVVSYEKKQNEMELEEIKNTTEDGRIRIKVEKNCRDFIEDGRKNEVFEVDGNRFNQITSDTVHSFLGLKYYIYYLERTN